MENNVVFYEFVPTEHKLHQKRIIKQLARAGFEGLLKVYDLGGGGSGANNFIVEGIFQGQRCCCAVGYEEKRDNLIIRNTWTDHDEA
ncbi:hypothetical protein VV869_15700 [Photobacterium sp. MCCC 1A19761]|uniref:hypothetical protein n=1 Tax=Photobacterium sp. MCCC 1A19761 TaxID=3115000 RepID=UPI00307DFEF2